MTETVACPSCAARLSLPQIEEGTEYTCPRCLATVDLSAQGLQDQAIQPASTGDPPHTNVCPECGEAVESNWHWCSNCGVRIDGGDLSMHSHAAYKDIRRDQKSTSVGLIVLSVLGCLGLGYSIFLGVIAFADTKNLMWVVVPVGILLFLGAIGFVIASGKAYRNPAASGNARLVLGTFVWTTALYGGLLLLVFAALIVFFVVCLAMIATSGL